MRAKDAFSDYHPAVNALYFALVLLFSMCFMHPACLAVSLLAALLYSWRQRGGKALRFSLFFLLPGMLLAALLNPLFNHEGATLLAYLPTGNPLTLESLAYGLAAAVMLGAVVTWFTCYSQVMTGDKFVYLFGRLAPVLSLILAMALRFVPRLVEQARAIALARRGMRPAASGKKPGPLVRIRTSLALLSILISWSLEGALQTADSKNSRGYGLPGRTAFSLFRLESRDRWALAWLPGLALYLLAAWRSGGLYWRYFPTLKGVEVTPLIGSFLLAYLALCLTPLALDLYEGRD